MKKQFQKFIEYLYWKYCEPNIVSMTREQLGIFNKELDLSKLSKAEQKLYRVKARSYIKDKYFTGIMSMVIREILFDCKAGQPEKGIKSVEAMNCDRYSINGISLLREKFEELSVYNKEEPKEEMEEDEEYNVV